MNDVPLLALLVYSLSLWFGCYLLVRNIHKPAMRYAGSGLVAYAVGLALTTLLYQPDSTIYAVVLMLPSLLWFGAIIHLIPDISVSWRTLGVVTVGLTLVLIVALSLLRLSVIVALPVALSACGIWLLYRSIRRQPSKSLRPLVILLTATLFLGLGSAMMLIPPQWLRSDLVLLGVGFDLALLGYAVGVLDAYDEGEAFRVDFIQSFLTAAVAAILFGAQVIIAAQGSSTPYRVLLVGVMSSAILLAVGFPLLQSGVDRLVFGTRHPVQRERAELRAVANALAKQDETIDLARLDDDELAHLTRRALSHMNDLSRLATNPLLRLPEVDQLLELNHQPDNTLVRAMKLKEILAERIQWLKPRDKGGFGTSDDWRYYNALYFPYVVGLKPYSRRTFHDDLDETAEEALAWFRTSVPERTLHNWQNAAARLIAQNLRETQPDWQ